MKKVIIIKGPRAEAGSPTIDFAGYAKDGGFERLLEDMQSGRNPVRQVRLTDSEGNGLRVIIRRTGTISYHVHYFAPERRAESEMDDDNPEETGVRPLLKVGTYPKTSVSVARTRAKTVTTLAANGIDVRWGLHDRLMREIDKAGTKWRP